jgi:fatty-acid desaturase
MLWVGLVPMFTLIFSAGLHRTFSHAKTGIRNLWFLEYIVPMGGEWLHDEHHNSAKNPIFSNRWYEIDTGSVFVWLLKNRSS